MNKKYLIELLSRGGRHWWRIRRRGNNATIATSETYTTAGKARAAATAFQLALLTRPRLEVVEANALACAKRLNDIV